MKKRNIIIILVVIAVLIVAKSILSVRKGQIQNDILPTTKQMTIAIVDARQGTLKSEAPFLAQIISDKSIKLSTKIAGYVQKVLVQESQNVKKGDLLVQIDAIEVSSNIRATKATLEAQKSDFMIAKNVHNRNKKLYKVGGVAKENVDISLGILKMKVASIHSTEEKLKQLQHQLSYLKIVAPFDGHIDAILLYEGDLAASGKAILSMSNSKKKLLFSYSPSKNSLIKKEQDVMMDDKLVGYVNTIYTTSSNGLISAEVTLSKEISYPVGSSVSISVLTKKAKGCILPENTILHKKDGTFVMAYNDGNFTAMEVNIDMQTSNEILVSPCPTQSVARAIEMKLAELPAYNDVLVQKSNNE